MLVLFCRPYSGRILEALHVDPASGVTLDKDKSTKVVKPAVRFVIMPEKILMLFPRIGFIWSI